jgi:hypothetical protein
LSEIPRSAAFGIHYSSFLLENSAVLLPQHNITALQTKTEYVSIVMKNIKFPSLRRVEHFAPAINGTCLTVSTDRATLPYRKLIDFSEGA